MADGQEAPMSQFNRFTPQPKVKATKKTASGQAIVDYKDVDKLSRLRA
jgi:hypothetical protein